MRQVLDQIKVAQNRHQRTFFSVSPMARATLTRLPPSSEISRRSAEAASRVAKSSARRSGAAEEEEVRKRKETSSASLRPEPA